MTNKTHISEQLEHYHHHWPTTKGKVTVGERAVLHGRDILYDLRKMDWLSLHFFSITSFEPDPKKLEAMMHIWAGCSYPDPRIWNNRIAALAGSARSTAGLAFGAASAVSEATIYGNRANIKCLDTLLRAHDAVNNGTDLKDFILSEIKIGRKIFGYGRPVRNKDERIPAMMEHLKELELLDDPYIQIALQMEQILGDLKGLCMNSSGISAGIAASLGLTPRQYHVFLSPVFGIGFSPCYMEATEKPETCLFPVKCTEVKYTGPQCSDW